jgi:hypothetical protein
MCHSIKNDSLSSVKLFIHFLKLFMRNLSKEITLIMIVAATIVSCSKESLIQEIKTPMENSKTIYSANLSKSDTPYVSGVKLDTPYLAGNLHKGVDTPYLGHKLLDTPYVNGGIHKNMDTPYVVTKSLDTPYVRR